MRIYSHEEAMRISEFVRENEQVEDHGQKYILARVELALIKENSYKNYKEYQDAGLGDVIESLLYRYEEAPAIPPVILDFDKTVMFGNIRVTTLQYAGHEKIQAFIKISSKETEKW